MTDTAYEIRCNHCGAAVPSTAETCAGCGTALLGPTAAPPLPELLTPSSNSRAAPSQLDWAAAAAAAEPAYEVGHWGFGGFWIRLAAHLVDYFISVVVVVAATLSFHLIGFLIALLLALLYHPLMESSPFQATVGKRLCGLAVVDTSGKRVSILRATVRHLAKFLSGVIFGIGFLMIAFTERRRGLHDIIAGTLVVKDFK